MDHPNFNIVAVSLEYFIRNIEYAKMVLNEYSNQKEKACSWFGPKKPFVITHPKLTDNAFMAKKALSKSKRGGYRENAGRKKGEPTTTLRVPVALVEKIKEIVKKHKDKSLLA